MGCQTTQGKPEVSEEDALQEAIRLSLQEDAKPEDKKQKTDEVDEESFEDLYDDGETTKKSEEKPKPVECTLNLDAVAMENTTQICAVFGVPEEKKMIVYKWVKAKDTNAVNELLNLYIDEMAGRI